MSIPCYCMASGYPGIGLAIRLAVRFSGNSRNTGSWKYNVVSGYVGFGLSRFAGNSYVH